MLKPKGKLSMLPTMLNMQLTDILCFFSASLFSGLPVATFLPYLPCLGNECDKA